ncbi:hypothetical protein [Granulicella sp. dw_53]|nr:hypothetical protein [Granulicella sp. dw_53]
MLTKKVTGFGGEFFSGDGVTGVCVLSVVRLVGLEVALGGVVLFFRRRD